MNIEICKYQVYYKVDIALNIEMYLCINHDLKRTRKYSIRMTCLSYS